MNLGHIQVATTTLIHTMLAPGSSESDFSEEAFWAAVVTSYQWTFRQDHHCWSPT